MSPKTKNSIHSRRRQRLWGWLLPISLVAVVAIEGIAGISLKHLLVLEGDLSALTHKPWSLLSYAWWHSAGNFIIPTILLSIALLWHGISVRKIYMIFFIGVLIGGIVFLLLFPYLAPYQTYTLSGASAGIAGILGYVVPKYWAMRKAHHAPLAWAYAILIAVITVDLLTFAPNNYPAVAVHLAGYAVGVLFFVNSFVFKNNSRKFVSSSNEQLLHKARTSGYGSLTDEEKRLLNNGKV